MEKEKKLEVDECSFITVASGPKAEVATQQCPVWLYTDVDAHLAIVLPRSYSASAMSTWQLLQHSLPLRWHWLDPNPYSLLACHSVYFVSLLIRAPSLFDNIPSILQISSPSLLSSQLVVFCLL